MLSKGKTDPIAQCRSHGAERRAPACDLRDRRHDRGDRAQPGCSIRDGSVLRDCESEEGRHHTILYDFVAWRQQLPLHAADTRTCNFMNCRLRRLAKAALPVIWQQPSAPRDIAVALEIDGKIIEGECHVQPENVLVARRRRHRRAPIGLCPASITEGRAMQMWGPTSRTTTLMSRARS